MRINYPGSWISPLILASLCAWTAAIPKFARAQSAPPVWSPSPWSDQSTQAPPTHGYVLPTAPLSPVGPGGNLIQPAPSYGMPFSQALPAAGVPLGGVQPLDAGYFNQLAPAGPPVVQSVGLTEATIAPANQITAEPLPPGARNGVFQKIYFTGTWLPALSDDPDALGFGDLETGVVFGFPFPRRDAPLLVTPWFGAHFLDNADSLDIPAELYDAAVEFRHMRKFGGGPWAMDAAVTVGYYSDFDQSDGEAVRASGRAVGVYESSPTTKWILGAAYLNRAGASVIPVGGVIYEPSPDVRLELLFPKPRVAWRMPGSQLNDERWIYVAGEFGGGVWSITRPSSGTLDLLSYSDWRVLVGLERKVIGGFTRRFELGYVFNRELEFDSATPDATLDDTLFVRAGLSY